MPGFRYWGAWIRARKIWEFLGGKGVLVSNQGGAPVTYSVNVAGDPVASGTITAGGSVTPTLPGRMGGPVEVTADGPIMASQRVLYNGYFNEVLGTSLSG